MFHSINCPKIAETSLQGIRNSDTFETFDSINCPKIAETSLQGIKNSDTFETFDMQHKLP
jgi:hypothetical protein